MPRRSHRSRTGLDGGSAAPTRGDCAARSSRYRAAMGYPVWTDLDSVADVAAAVEQARTAVTALRRHPANRTGWPRTSAAASLRAARASAALDGAGLALDPEATSVTDPILAGSLRVASAIGSMAPIWQRSPLQVLARLHALAAVDLVPAAQLGRPHTSDPLVGARLARFAEMVTTADWSAPVQIAVVHGELLAISPFGCANGVVARAAARLAMITTGLDPAGLAVPEVAHLRSATRYQDRAAGYATGDRTGTVDWILEVCHCLVGGAREGVGIADAAV